MNEITSAVLKLRVKLRAEGWRDSNIYHNSINCPIDFASLSFPEYSYFCYCKCEAKSWVVEDITW